MKTQIVVDANNKVSVEVRFAPPVVASCLGRMMLLQFPPARSCITSFPPRPEQLRNVSCFKISLNLVFWLVFLCVWKFAAVMGLQCQQREGSLQLYWLGGRKQLLK